MWISIRRGLRLRCPSCGDGALLEGYLRPRHVCDRCKEDLGALRADDGPAWATILVVGHLVSPAFVLFARPDAAATLYPFLIMAGLVVVLTLALLPRMKGLFMAAIWASRAGEAVEDAPSVRS
jgi:uncharacterized protein (DUF983 family)